MEKFGRRKFIKVVGQSVSALCFGISHWEALAQCKELMNAQKERINTLADREIVDIHCHLFNAQYSIMEFIAATWNSLLGNYPHKHTITKEKILPGKIKDEQGVINFAAWIARLLDVALSDCVDNLKTEIEMFKKSAMCNRSSLLMTPLMMDIYFALDDNKDEEANQRKKLGEPIAEEFKIPDNQKGLFEKHFSECKGLIIFEYQKLLKKKKLTSKELNFKIKEIKKIFDDVRKNLLDTDLYELKEMKYNGIELSPGYRKHMYDLENLYKNCPGQVFPFLAVDPRRIGIMKLMEMKINKGKGVFKGIKLYPPLGYLPTHPNLKQIFAYCEEYDIPVTVHCSEGGIQNFKNENYIRSFTGDNHLEDFSSVNGKKSRFYAAPKNWENVLKEWPKLRINFAHFGGGDKISSGDLGWMNDIIELMKFDNVYTDISYHTNPELPQKILKIVSENDILKNKLMFGTDYIMIMLDFHLGGLENYFNQFSGLDNKLLCNNAKRFLKI